METKKLIPLEDLEDYIMLIQYEQTFRVKLHLYKELAEFRLKYVQELKPLAEKLKNLRQLVRNKGLIKDKDLDMEIRNIINKKFIGGVINEEVKI